MALPSGLGISSYNGVSFDASTVTLVDMTPVLTQDGRTVSYLLYLLKVRGYVTSGPAVLNTDTTLNTWRDALGATAGTLTLSGKGYGTFTINAAGGGGVRDVKWGPIPRTLSWQPLGGGKAARVEWECEVHIPCSDADTRSGGLLEASYSYRVTTDYAGLSTRVVSGYARIAVTRLGPASKVVPATVDDYKERLYPAVPVGFKRLRGNWDISADKAEVHYEVEDEQLPGPNAQPEGSVKADVSHRVSSDGKGNFNKWLGSVSANYEMATDHQRAESFLHFRELLRKRLGFGLGFQNNPQGFAYLWSLELAEPDVHGRNVGTFNATYLLVVKSASIVAASGLWTPTGGDFKKWKASLDLTAWKPRGSAGLKLRTTDDAIVSLCVNDKESTLKPGPPPAFPFGPGGRLETIRPKVPPPDYSWLYFWNQLVVELRGGITIHTPVPTAPIKPVDQGSGHRPAPERPPAGTFQPGGAFEGPVFREGPPAESKLRALTGPPALTQNTAPTAPHYREGEGGKSIKQYRAKPRFFIRMVGRAVRVAYEVPLPQLLSVGGAECVPMNEGDGFTVETADPIGGLPVRIVNWDLRYGLLSTPGAIPTPYNPGALPG